MNLMCRLLFHTLTPPRHWNHEVHSLRRAHCVVRPLSLMQQMLSRALLRVSRRVRGLSSDHGNVANSTDLISGVTGGGSATPVYPSTTTELINYLKDSSARVIVLTKTFDFTGTEGTATSSGCA